jgi:hypothetical protein
VRTVALLLLIVLAFHPPAHAQLAPLAEGGARALALGRAGTALSGDVWGLHNPGAWATLDRGGAGLLASQAFGMPELRVAAAAVAYPTPFGVATASARTYGFEAFREQVLGVGFARAMPVSPTRRIHAGAALRYTGVSVPEFGSAGALGLSAGLLVELLPGLDFGAHALNVNRPALSDRDPLESRLDAGVAWRAHPQALVLLAASKDAEYPLSVRGGAEVRPGDVLVLRTGFSTAPTRFAAGVGLALGRLRADLAAEHHEALGWTPAVELGVTW